MKVSVLESRRVNPLVHRACPQCEARMWLTVIEPDKPGYDKCTFECTNCRHKELVVFES